MRSIVSDKTTSISEFRKNISQAVDEPVAVLSNNKPAFYAVPPEVFEQMVEALEDQFLGKLAAARLAENDTIEVSLDAL